MVTVKIVQLQMAKLELGAPKLVFPEHWEGNGSGRVNDLSEEGEATHPGRGEASYSSQDPSSF